MHTMHLQVPEPWLDVVWDLGRFVPNRIWLAGGALRDLHLGREVKDLDLWLAAGADLDALMPAVEGWKQVNTVTAASTPGDLAFTGTYILPPGAWGETMPPVNLIQMARATTLEDILGSFDYGICQIGMGVDRVVLATDAYIHDVASATITRTNYDRTEINAAQRRSRLATKFPHWRIVENWPPAEPEDLWAAE